MSLLDQIKTKVPAELLVTRDALAIASAFNAGRSRQDHATKFTSLGISERFPALGALPGPLAAEMVLQKLEGFREAALSSADPATKLLGGAIKRQMQHLEGNGMAIGSPAVAQMLAVIVAAGGLTQPEMDALVSVASVPDPVTEIDVRRALWSDAGEYLA